MATCEEIHDFRRFYILRKRGTLSETGSVYLRLQVEIFIKTCQD